MRATCLRCLDYLRGTNASENARALQRHGMQRQGSGRAGIPCSKPPRWRQRFQGQRAAWASRAWGTGAPEARKPPIQLSCTLYLLHRVPSLQITSQDGSGRCGCPCCLVQVCSRNYPAEMTSVGLARAGGCQRQQGVGRGTVEIIGVVQCQRQQLDRHATAVSGCRGASFCSIRQQGRVWPAGEPAPPHRPQPAAAGRRLQIKSV